MKIIRLILFKHHLIRDPIFRDSEHYEIMKDALTFSGCLDAIGKFELWHITGTRTVMVDDTTIGRLMDFFHKFEPKLTNTASRLFQGKPNNSTSYIIKMRSDLQVVSAITNQNKKSLEYKKDKEAELEQRERKKYQGASRVLQQVKDIIGVAKLLCIDIEAFEFNQKEILEIGLTTYHRGDINTTHLVIEDYLRHHNGRHVADNRDHFLFGESRICSLDTALFITIQLINEADYLVGHSFLQDQEYLRPYIPTIMDADVFDTAGVSKCIIPSTNRTVGLKELMDICGIEYSRLHNGGNDAHFTMQTLIAMTKMQPYKMVQPE